MNNKVLISTALLNAYWEKEKKDTLDLLIPFVEYSIAKTTEIGESIDILKLSSYLKTELGYDTIPLNVITLILNRLTPSALKKQNGNYYLSSSLDAVILNFERGHARYTEHCSKVAIALRDYMNDNLISRDSYDEEFALQALLTFFAQKGICIIRDTSLLELLKKKDDTVSYCIAQFILLEYEKKSEIFSYIDEMVKGFFISMVISLQPQNPSISQSKFKGMSCYLDTRVIINALGLHLDEAKTAALELIDMFKEKGARLYCFEHNYYEIYDILTAYKYGLTNPYNNRSYRTLERWDAQKYTVTDVERYQMLLDQKIKALGIEIVSKPSFGEMTEYPIDEVELKNYIERYMKYSNTSALELDIQSVVSILLLRNGNKSSVIEKCGSLFITSNVELANVVNLYLIEQGIYKSEKEVMPLMTDTDAASIVWLKCYSTHAEYPVKRLIEHAMTALEPTPTMIKTFFDMLDHIQAEGGISEDEASIIRVDAFCRKELAKSMKGNPDNISEQTIYDIKDKLRELYVGEETKKSELNYRNYIKQREENRKTIKNALTQIKEYGQKVYQIAYRVLSILSWLIILSITTGFIIASIVSVGDTTHILSAIILLIFSVISLLDMFVGKLNRVKRFNKKISKCIADAYSDKKKIEYESILGTIEYDMPE